MKKKKFKTTYGIGYSREKSILDKSMHIQQITGEIINCDNTPPYGTDYFIAKPLE